MSIQILVSRTNQKSHQKELDSEDLDAAVTENSDTTDRKVSENFNTSHMAVLAELKKIGSFSFTGSKMGPSRPVSREMHITCGLLRVIAYITTSSALFVPT